MALRQGDDVLMKMLSVRKESNRVVNTSSSSIFSKGVYMGQRLVVNIVRNDETIACGYYHWSAYTESAAEITRDIVKNIIKADYEAHNYFLYTENANNATAINKLAAYLLLEYTGAGIYHANSDDDIEEFKKLKAAVNYRLGENRSEGLIALTPSSIKYFNDWAEGTVYIDISNDTVHFDVFGWYLEDEINGLIKEGVIEKNEMKELDYENISNFNFEEVDTWFDKVEEMCKDSTWPYFKDKNEPIYRTVIA